MKSKFIENEPVFCPICGQNPDEDGECVHLAFHGDDLRTSTVLDETGPNGCWEKFETLAPGFLPESATEFFAKFSRHLSALEELVRSFWTGGAPGLSGHYSFVWAKDSGKLMDEIRTFLDSELQKRNSAKSRLNQSENRKPRRKV